MGWVILLWRAFGSARGRDAFGKDFRESWGWDDALVNTDPEEMGLCRTGGSGLGCIPG